LQPTDQEKPERRPEIQQPDALVNGGGEPALHFRLWRYAIRLSRSCGDRFWGGISAPGLSDGAFMIQRCSVSVVLGNNAPAIVARPPTWLRSGPTLPCATPAIVWQPMQALRRKTRSPASAGEPFAGVAGAARC